MCYRGDHHAVHLLLQRHKANPLGPHALAQPTMFGLGTTLNTYMIYVILYPRLIF
jgi:hypothetical protein